MIRLDVGVLRMRTVLCCVLVFAQAVALAARRKSYRPRQRAAFRYRCEMIEDAEDGDTAGWIVFDADPPGDPINIAEPKNKTNRVIQLQHYQTGYHLALPKMLKRGHIIQWRMKFRTNWYMYVTCQTNMGKLSVRYTPGTVSGRLADDPIVGLDIPAALKDWVTVRRNILTDFRALHPKIKLQGVTDFMARGDGYLDDVFLYDYTDGDGDILPDEYEKDHRLDPEDPRDAKPKHLERVIALSPCCPPEEDAGKEAPVVDEAADAINDGKRPKPPSTADAVRRKPKKKTPKLTREEKGQVRKELQRRYADYLSKLTHPKKGTPCTFRLRTGTVISGAVEKATHESVRIRGDRGIVSFPVARIHPDDAPKLFPKAKAHQKALAEVEDIKKSVLDQRSVARAPVPRVVPEAVGIGGETGDNAPLESTPTIDFAGPSLPVAGVDFGGGAETSQNAGGISYNPSRAITPTSLKPTLAMVAKWLVDHRAESTFRVAQRIYAKQSASAVILYVRCHAEFIDQDAALRLNASKAVQSEWVRCCGEAGSAAPGDAHVVMVGDAERIIGGSQPSDAAAVWALPY